MDRDRPRNPRVTPDHPHDPGERIVDCGERHPIGARARARPPGRTPRASDRRDAEAERQIRELRARC